MGNEVNQLSDRPHPTKMSATSQQIDAWLNALLPAVAGEGHNALYSVNDGTWFIDGHPFTPVQSATKGDMTVIHSWVFNGIAQGYGATSEECSSYALYLAELAKRSARIPSVRCGFRKSVRRRMCWKPTTRRNSAARPLNVPWIAGTCGV